MSNYIPKPTVNYLELTKQQLREQIKYDTEQYFKRGGKIKFYDQADNLVSEYVEKRDEG
jgi:hypothetical protein